MQNVRSGDHARDAELLVRGLHEVDRCSNLSLQGKVVAGRNPIAQTRRVEAANAIRLRQGNNCPSVTTIRAIAITEVGLNVH